MKKLPFIALLLTFYFSSFSQSFDGVAISGTLNAAIAKYKAKGYKFIKFHDSEIAIMTGFISNKRCEVYLTATPKTKTFCKISIYFPKLNDWEDLKSDYTNIRQVLINKYGEPDSNHEFFKDPYDEGDGYEMSAVDLDKCVYTAIWLYKNNMSIQVRISEFRQVNIIYESDKGMELRNKEKESLERSIF